MVQWNSKYPKSASLRWHYPNQVSGIFSVLNSQNTPCVSYCKTIQIFWTTGFIYTKYFREDYIMLWEKLKTSSLFFRVFAQVFHEFVT